MIYNVYPCLVFGNRMPNDWIVARVLCGELVLVSQPGQRFDVDLLDPAGTPLMHPLQSARMTDMERGYMLFTGMQFAGSTAPKSKRWAHYRQQWLCEPVPQA